MNFQKLYITSILLLSFFTQSYAVCEANFYFNESGELQIDFINESSSYDEGTIHYYWDFGDGSTSFETNPQHIYNVPGIYQISLTMITSGLCYDRIVHEIYVGIPETSPYCLLEIHFETTNATSPDYNDGTASVYAFSDVVCCYYAYWSNGMEGEYITNLEPGTYCVTLSNGEGCYGTNCVTIGYNNNCTSSFLVDSTTFSHLDGAYRFINNSHGESDYYHWDFGDGEEINAYNPLHIYSEPGTYNVCLEINTLYGCNDIFCQEINVGNTYPIISNLHGTVIAGENPLPQGTAVLYQVNNNVFTAIEKTFIEDGEYIFSDLSKDYLYLTHLIPNFDTDQTYFPKYIATYNDNDIFWQDNSYINLYTDTIYHSQLASYNEIYFGEGLISGQVRYSDISSYETDIFAQSWILPITPQPYLASNMVVLLKNNNHVILDSKLTNSNGEYFFNELEFGDYYLSVEKAGMTSDEIFVTLNESEIEKNNIDFNINQSNISGKFTEISINNLTLYPNPCADKITLLSIPNTVNKIELLNSEGKIIKTFSSLKKPYTITTSYLLSGFYTLKFYSKDNVFVKSFIKQ